MDSESIERVDLEQVYEAQRKIREAQEFLASLPELFCDQCGAVDPRHGFYHLFHSIATWKGEIVDSPRGVTCNCCHATEKYPCFYCEEERKTGKQIDIRERSEHDG